jgi:putative nucleotidyltransferase with HDIG domain
MLLAREMGIAEESIEKIKLAALLHDIGKIGVPDHILQKPGRLTEEEFAWIRKHPCLGAEILSKIPKIEDVVAGVRHHHEKWNGSGYPDALEGTQIPLFSRILCVADAYDAMTSNRAYRRNFNTEEAILEINRSIGSHFERPIAEAFLRYYEKES